MRLRNMNQQGIGALVIVLIVVLLGAIGGAGYYVYQNQESDNAADTDTINSFAECVAAGNPVMESFPEQCAANGQTFTNTEQSADTDTGWNTEVTSGQKGFSVIFPDGFGEVLKPIDSDSFYLMGTKQPTIEVGGPISIQELEGFGTDAPSLFAVLIHDNFVDPRGKVTDFTLTNGKVNPIKGKKYVYIYPEDEPESDGIGYRRLKDDRDYEYVFPLQDGKELRVFYHVYAEDPRNNEKTIEALIDTIRLN